MIVRNGLQRKKETESSRSDTIESRLTERPDARRKSRQSWEISSRRRQIATKMPLMARLLGNYEKSLRF